MEILLVAATSFEIQLTIDYLKEKGGGSGTVSVTPLIAGVGSLQTSWALTRQLERTRPALVLQAGIAGCFTDKPQGTVLAVREEVLADLGVWEGPAFQSLFAMRLADPDGFPFTGGRLFNPHESLFALAGLESVRAMTVNEISTDAKRIAWQQQNTSAVVESMEGGALHYVCLQAGVPFLQLRSVSNAVGVRDKAKWNIPLAIARLNAELIGLLQKLEKQNKA
ncbi:MAG TPA: futalosine hydrolase [Puia sp.]|nr:futalosine hydrolase [Puia sp.]